MHWPYFVEHKKKGCLTALKEHDDGNVLSELYFKTQCLRPVCLTHLDHSFHHVVLLHRYICLWPDHSSHPSHRPPHKHSPARNVRPDTLRITQDHQSSQIIWKKLQLHYFMNTLKESFTACAVNTSHTTELNAQANCLTCLYRFRCLRDTVFVIFTFVRLTQIASGTDETRCTLAGARDRNTKSSIQTLTLPLAVGSIETFSTPYITKHTHDCTHLHVHNKHQVYKPANHNQVLYGMVCINVFK